MLSILNIKWLTSNDNEDFPGTIIWLYITAYVQAYFLTLSGNYE